MGSLAFVESNLTGTGMRALRFAHESGWRTLFVTADLSMYTKDAAAAATIDECADEIVECPSTIDPDLVEKHLLDHRDDLVGVLTVGEYYVPVATEVAARLGLPGLSPAAALLARNKLESRRACSAAGVPVPAFGFAGNAVETAEVLARTGLPCVVKPVDESASVGVSLCRGEGEVTARIIELSASDRNSRGQRHTPGGLIEQCVFGPEVSVETVTYQGKHTVLGVTEKSVGQVPWFVETGHTFPSALPPTVTEPAAAVALAALDAIGFDFGAAHTELKLTADGPVLIEINPRTPGDHIPTLVRNATGVGLLEQYVAMHAGAAPRLSPTTTAASAIRFLTGREGTVRAVDGISEAERVPGVVEVALRVTAGAHTHWPTNSHHRIGHVIAVGTTPAEASARAEAARALLTVAY
ncbi:ATP-grasp domain-containing protein [Actinokineospora enzanensis]|uniref:ATP-grasp domain-containing protein n=1 Tax=Actinokineospora enzanensis TaxID=155975 RepID=UPI0003761C0A|nr:ATP-grasp domain-containing protein [Actinokineospora enzanensis]